MLRGRKRYLLNPPRACPVLDIISDKTHPSFRHSDVDWSDEADWPEVSRASGWLFGSVFFRAEPSNAIDTLGQRRTLVWKFFIYLFRYLLSAHQ